MERINQLRTEEIEQHRRLFDCVGEEIQRRGLAESKLVAEKTQTTDGSYSETNLIVSTEDELLNTVIAISYVNLMDNRFEKKYLAQMSILALEADKVMDINKKMLSFFNGQEYLYLSADYISLASENYDANVDLYPQILLNGLEYAHLPSHKLHLKVGIPILILRKINRGEGIVEGTRLVVTQLGEHEIRAEVLTGAGAGKIAIIPRMRMMLDSTLPIVRYQFPVKVCFAMMVANGKQQNLCNAGFYLSSGSYNENPKYIGVSTKEAMYGSSLLEITIIKREHPENQYTRSTIYKKNFENLQFIDDTISQAIAHASSMDD